jgi:hypothetical protein
MRCRPTVYEAWAGSARAVTMRRAMVPLRARIPEIAPAARSGRPPARPVQAAVGGGGGKRCRVITATATVGNQTALYTQAPADQVGTACGLNRTFSYFRSIASAS